MKIRPFVQQTDHQLQFGDVWFLFFKVSQMDVNVSTMKVYTAIIRSIESLESMQHVFFGSYAVNWWVFVATWSNSVKY